MPLALSSLICFAPLVIMASSLAKVSILKGYVLLFYLRICWYQNYMWTIRAYYCIGQHCLPSLEVSYFGWQYETAGLKDIRTSK
uniref:Uncharacterized protein n=1 Tax=Rhizophora mucronata TaxID=61149 RepID=A0A2P2L3E7_RHIMU